MIVDLENIKSPPLLSVYTNKQNMVLSTPLNVVMFEICNSGIGVKQYGLNSEFLFVKSDLKLVQMYLKI